MNPYLEIALRAVGAYLGMLLITRMLGKEQLGELSVGDFVNAIAIGSIAAAMATDHKENVIYYIIGLIIFGTLTYLTNITGLKSRAARKLLEGEPTIIIHNGKILEKNMRKERYSMDNLAMQLREKSVFNIADVEFAVLETNGDLSILLKSDKQPLTAGDIHVFTPYKGIASEVIVDGKLIQQNLQQNKLTMDWLNDRLRERGVKNIEEVAYASLDTSGNLFIDKYRDDLPYLQEEK
ncbi:MAG: YetF domain-containing protein [Bacillota bacterium]